MSVFAADRDQLHAMTTPAVGIWVRASCQPGSVRGGPDRSPGGCGARCTKHHAGTHRREIESACQNTNTRCREQCHLHQRSLPYAHSHQRCAERRRDRCGGGRHPRPQYPGVDLDRPVRRRQGAGVPTVSPRSSRRSPGYRRWTPTTGPASTSATPPPGSEPDATTADDRCSPRPATLDHNTGAGERERAESELTSPNYAGVGTTTVGPIRRKGSS